MWQTANSASLFQSCDQTVDAGLRLQAQGLFQASTGPFFLRREANNVSMPLALAAMNAILPRGLALVPELEQIFRTAIPCPFAPRVVPGLALGGLKPLGQIVRRRRELGWGRWVGTGQGMDRLGKAWAKPR